MAALLGELHPGHLRIVEDKPVIVPPPVSWVATVAQRSSAALADVDLQPGSFQSCVVAAASGALQAKYAKGIGQHIAADYPPLVPG